MKPSAVWRVLSWVLFGAFLLAAVLNMTGTPAGFATNHLADLVTPAWVYIVLRGLAEPRKRSWLGRFIGATPERAAIVLLVGSGVTELTQIHWPSGPFAGRFDPLDLVAFAIGLVPLYLVDKRLQASSRATEPRTMP